MPRYCIRCCIPILHRFQEQGEPHSHTIEVASYIRTLADGSLSFGDMEKPIQGYLSHFSGQYLNDMPEFQGTNAAIEDMGEVFFQGMTELLRKENIVLTRLEVGETPLRVFAIGMEGSE